MNGRKLGKYEIIERIGRGGMAEVYRAYHSALDRYVAIKILHPFLSDDPEFKDRFEREARNVAKLKHPNIVQVYDFDYDPEGESYYMVMELINGPTLKDRLFDLGSVGQHFAVNDTLHIIGSAAEALAYAHARNMIHRDVKPANLMIDEDSRVVLTDFGIAKIVTGAQFTSTGGMIGTPAYMAPEQGMAEPGDERSDIYSLGAIMYQMTTGRLPFDADTPLAVILKHLNEPLIPPSDIAPDIPEPLERIICKSLEKDPTNRYQSAIEMLQDIDEMSGPNRRPRQYDTLAWMQSNGQLSTREMAPVLSEGGSRGRMRPARVIALALAVTLLAIVGLASFSSDDGLFASFLTTRSTDTPAVTETLAAQSPTGAAIALGETADPAEATPSETSDPTDTIEPSITPTDHPTLTGTPDLTQTAIVMLATTVAAAPPTPDMTQTLAACDFGYIVVGPENLGIPPSTLPKDYNNPRLVRANQDFTFELILKNTGACAWPKRVRLRYNEELSMNPENLDLEPIYDACQDTELRDPVNFANQAQTNFYFQQAVDVDEQSDALIFTGTGPRVYGCYYGVWDVLYPDSNVHIGKPLLMAIRVWGAN
ncbi:MAG TPA: protein kinase [Aggregatilinea sp.]|uniref:serine/threonine protein kinase n=1 Tax=Aggregatilinea sp. TaxID=2806333 RepID=UPI002C79301C|nr:protein kinase [Aggregatilinea sp.]HML23242.1 protein kinase [Aggregatilinea sp.]